MEGSWVIDIYIYHIYIYMIYDMYIYIEGLCKVGLHFAIAKLVQIIPISLWFVVLATIDTGVYKPI